MGGQLLQVGAHIEDQRSGSAVCQTEFPSKVERNANLVALHTLQPRSSGEVAAGEPITSHTVRAESVAVNRPGGGHHISG